MGSAAAAVGSLLPGRDGAVRAGCVAVTGAVVEFVVLTVLIVLVARFMLYQPAKVIAQRLRFSAHGSGQLLGYLTSAPELVAAISVGATGLFATVAFNIVSSNVINVVLGLSAAVVFGQVRGFFARRFWREHLMVAASIVVPVGLLVSGQESAVWVVPVFVAAYGLYLVVVRRLALSAGPEEAHDVKQVGSVPDAGRLRLVVAVNAGVIVLALFALYVLGSMLGSVVFDLGTTFGVPELVLGVVIGVVTSLPEFTTFFSAYAWHRRAKTGRANEEVVHNLLASNVSNLLLIQTAGLLVFLLFAA